MEVVESATSDYQRSLQQLESFQHKPRRAQSLTDLAKDGRADFDYPDDEPVFDPEVLANVQGNILPGFNKPHQHFLFVGITDVANAKKWLFDFSSKLTSLAEVIPFKRKLKLQRLRTGQRQTGMRAVWTNIGFSNHGIAKLTSQAALRAFGDQSFKQGLSERSGYIGDPVDPSHEGNRENWVIGGPDNEADVLIIVAADNPEDLKQEVWNIKDNLERFKQNLMYEQSGDTLPEPLAGHEHFGFRDGISQPGVRGKLSLAPGDYLTPRYLKPSDQRSRYFAKPGQLLLWPGQFLLGERQQHPDDLFGSADASSRFPDWAKHGSYLVCRRLKQNVSAFWKFMNATAETLDEDPIRFASLLVGRWPSGAPTSRTPHSNDDRLAGDEFSNNHFLFDDDTRPSNLLDIPDHYGDTHPAAIADPLGTRCPHFAHIRKTNPRDMATDLGKPQDSLLRMILRRGIPFGQPVAGVKNPSDELLNEERGLMFICYGATIEDQFEFLVRRWVNNPVQPNDGGFDPILGRVDGLNGRKRFIDYPANDGAKRIQINDEWITPTGGGYFFSPTIEAMKQVLAA